MTKETNPIDPPHTDQPSSGRPASSLRRRYLIASIGLIGLLLLTLTLAYRYIADVTAQNNQALSLANRVAIALDIIPSAVRESDHALQDLLAEPARHHSSTIVQHIHTAHSQVVDLARDPDLQAIAWLPELHKLEAQLALLAQYMQDLQKQYRQPGWLYPAIPLIAGTMYEANNAFDTGLNHAITETGDQLDEPGQIELYTRLVKLRDMWRRLILDFRSHMIQFAGQPNLAAPDHSAMDELSALILMRIQELQANKGALEYGFETTEVIDAMPHWLDAWLADYHLVRELQASRHWRSDAQYIEQVIRPLQQQISQQLFLLDRTVADWSTETSSAVRSAAADMNYVLWGVALLGLALVLINYVILDYGLLRPVIEVSRALSAEARGADTSTLPSSRHIEVAQLITAFEHMRSQIQTRQHALEHQALHDVLTNLPNRALLQDRLDQGLRAIQRSKASLSLLLLDLDRFKEINDTLGHQVGDEVLTEVAQRLLTLVRKSDTVARLGGDEFALVLPGMNREEATELARRIATTLDTPHVINDQPLFLGASIGVVLAPEDGADAATLIRHADSAMYRAKHANWDYAFYDPEHDKVASEGVHLTARLRQALTETDTLALHYQPRMAMDSERITGCEALLRWQDGEDWIPAERVVQLAEHANLIKDLTRWVLHRALRDCAQWRARGADLQVSVNLSARNLDDSALPAIVQAALHQYRLPASTLILEITESAVMAEPKRAKQLLGELADMGITLSIDDFGTGFSSLAYLSQLPVQELKIDKSFVFGMVRSHHDALIVKAIIELAHNLGLQVVAEGVEDEQTLRLLRDGRCNMAQGYWISRPIPLEQLYEYLKPDNEPNSALNHS